MVVSSFLFPLLPTHYGIVIFICANTVIPSAVSGGVASLVQGSYQYYHYLHEGLDDSVIISFLKTP